MKATQVRCSIEGLNLERFLHRAAECGVKVSCISRNDRLITAVVPEDDWERLCAVAQQGGWRLTCKSVHGLGAAVMSLKRRWFMLLCTLAVVFAFAAASQCVLRVDVSGAGAYAHDIESFLHETGVHLPMRKADCDLIRLREALQWRYPDIAYIDCAFRGTTLTVLVHEGQPGKNTSDVTFCDVVAARDGIIVSIVTTTGTPAVSPGDVVRKGDVLISGTEKGREDEIVPVQADGIVTARVWDAATVTMPMTATDTLYTGQHIATLNVGTPWFPLWPVDEVPFLQCDRSITTMPLGGIFIPLQVTRTICSEHILSESRLDPEAVTQMAGEAALQKLLAANGFADDFVDKWIEYSMIDNEVVCASAYGERITDIAIRDTPQ